ncbi:MAG: cytochrome c biogenesis protein CcdA [Bryobacter sp.]|nr:cytochrome c biogenesis protein CcdA [Bryobacter sp.]
MGRLALGLLLVAAAALPQRLDPIQWALGPFPAAKAGEEIKIPVRARMDSHWHLYSLTTPRPPIATKVQAAAEAPYEVLRVDQPAPIKKVDPNFGSETETFDDAVEFTLVAKATKDIAANDPALRVEVRYQACDDRQCLPPRKKQVEYLADFAFNPPARPAAPVASSAANSSTSPVGPGPATPAQQPLGEFLLLAFGFGLASVLTPCVFPMIPITMSYFLTKQGASRGRIVGEAMVFCFGIIVLFTAIGFALTALLGASGVVSIGSNVYVNLFISAIFFALALSLLGAYEITLPSGLLTRLNQASEGGGVVGTLLMGLTFSLTSFACVGPFIGTLLAASVTGDKLQPTLGMMSFSAGLSLPFFFLALFPSAMSKMPRAGNWMVRIKIVMGFLILAAMLKYLSNVDVVLQWNLLTRERFLALWAVLFALPGLYLLGKLPMDGIKRDEELGPGRALAGAVFLAFALSLLPGMFGANLGELEAMVPFAKENAGLFGGSGSEKLPWMKDDFEGALARAKAENKPILVAFTGVACTNCHWMKANMFTKPEVASAMKEFVLVELYTDVLDDPKSEANQQRQENLFATVAIPYYAVFNADEKVVASFPGLTRKAEEFLAFLAKARSAA